MGKHPRSDGPVRGHVIAIDRARQNRTKQLISGMTACTLLFTVAATHATTVDEGSVIDLDADSSFFADCDDILINGTVNMLAGAELNANSITIGPGGVLNGGGGTIYVNTAWSNTGTFSSGNSTVRPSATCGNTSTTFAGNSSFYNLIVGTHTIVLPVGLTQTVTGQLTLQGSRVQSNVANQVAYLNLTATGSQNIAAVTVLDVHATGQWLAAGQTNGTGGRNANRWFGTGEDTAPVPVTTGGLLSLLLTALTLIWGVLRQQSGPSAHRATKDY